MLKLFSIVFAACVLICGWSEANGPLINDDESEEHEYSKEEYSSSSKTKKSPRRQSLRVANVVKSPVLQMRIKMMKFLH